MTISQAVYEAQIARIADLQARVNELAEVVERDEMRLGLLVHERDEARSRLDTAQAELANRDDEINHAHKLHNEALGRLSSGLELAKALHASTGFERMGELVGILAGWACEICKKPVSEGPRPGTDGVICCHCALGPERREDTFTVSKRVVEKHAHLTERVQRYGHEAPPPVDLPNVYGDAEQEVGRAIRRFQEVAAEGQCPACLDRANGKPFDWNRPHICAGV